jgi:hypothetical protein
VTTEVDEILTQLRLAGERRNRASRHTAHGMAERAAALADIRAYAAEARRLKVTHRQLADAVGVKRSAWFELMNGTVQS